MSSQAVSTTSAFSDYLLWAGEHDAAVASAAPEAKLEPAASRPARPTNLNRGPAGTAVAGPGAAEAALAPRSRARHGDQLQHAPVQSPIAAKQASEAEFAAYDQPGRPASGGVGYRCPGPGAGPARGAPGGPTPAASSGHHTHGADRWDFMASSLDFSGRSSADELFDATTLYVPQASSRGYGFSPFERAFLELKQKHRDLVLFVRVGQFYNLFEADGEDLSLRPPGAASIGPRPNSIRSIDSRPSLSIRIPPPSFLRRDCARRQLT